jgi:hypothetical protein
VPAPHRSIIPSVPGIPAGAAVLIAVACTLIGFFIDASGGGRDLTHVFAGAYIVGCALAALAVRYRGLFTTMVTPPLLLFIAVPVAYGQLMSHTSSSMKDILLNQGIPLVNRFPVMAIATVIVLAIGLGRVVLQRRLEDAKPRARGQRARKGDSWGPRATTERSRRGRGAGSSDTLRSRARTQSATDAKAATKPTRGGRKTTGRVAERPPRVSAAQGAPSSRTAERAKVAAARQRGDADAPPPRGRSAEPGRGRSAEPQPRRRAADAPAQPRQRGAAPSRNPNSAAPSRNPNPNQDQPPPRRRAQEPRQRAADPQPQRRSRTTDYGDVPPHPRPNVRYRERDSGRIEH